MLDGRVPVTFDRELPNRVEHGKVQADEGLGEVRFTLLGPSRFRQSEL